MITHKEHRRIGIATLCTQPSLSLSLRSKPSRPCADVDKSIKYLSMQGEPSAVVVVYHIVYVGKKIQLLILTTACYILTLQYSDDKVLA